MAAFAPYKPLHVLFVGAGAVGCFYASRIHSVHLRFMPIDIKD